MSKAIQIIPKPDVSRKIDAYKTQLRTSRAGFCEIAVETILEKFDAGEMAFVNGKFVAVKPSSKAA